METLLEGLGFGSLAFLILAGFALVIWVLDRTGRR